MDTRSAAHALAQVAVLLELHGDDRVSPRLLQGAARVIGALGERDLHDALTSETDREVIAELPPLARDILLDLDASNSSAMLERLQEETPEGLLEMLRVPGLGPARIRQIHDGLDIDTLQELEQSARDGRLAALPKFGQKTAERVLRGIADLRETGAFMLWQHAQVDAERLRAAIGNHPDVLHVEIAGSIRRRSEVVRDVDIVASVRGAPSVVAASIAHMPGVKDVLGGGGRVLTIRFHDGVQLDLVCVRPEQFSMALWRTTGSVLHVRQLTELANQRGFVLTGDEVRDRSGAIVPVASEPELYARLGLPYLAPELREGAGELELAARHSIGTLLDNDDIVGALHCHSQYSDGGATIAEMADAARARGWKYLGISDHSQSNTYAGGLSREAIAKQHDEIDALNTGYRANGVDFLLLKGIEADILPCGRVDYDAAFLDRFDFVIGSVHSRYGMNERQMTDRVLKALDDPHLTILGHPTGRLLLTREPYAIDMNAVIAKAGEVGVAVELNADPHRLDIDWRACRVAREKGTLVSIGPDAHSPAGLDHIAMGIGIARKGALGASHVLNSMTAAQVLAFARARRDRRARTAQIAAS
jgi:DNA polymerase (family 10)